MSANQKRGTTKKDSATLVAVWLPDELLKALDHIVKKDDSDRSKTIRKAIRRHITATGH